MTRPLTDAELVEFDLRTKRGDPHHRIAYRFGLRIIDVKELQASRR